MRKAEDIHLDSCWRNEQPLNVRNQSLLRQDEKERKKIIIIIIISSFEESLQKLNNTHEILFTDGSSMLEDTATLTVRSSSVMDLGRISEITAEDWEKHCTINQLLYENYDLRHEFMCHNGHPQSGLITCQGTSFPTLRPGGFSD